jgi:hypothetical protein
MEPALLASEARMAKRSQHGVSGGQDGRSERPATWHGQPRPTLIHSPSSEQPFAPPDAQACTANSPAARLGRFVCPMSQRSTDLAASRPS